MIVWPAICQSVTNDIEREQLCFFLLRLIYDNYTRLLVILTIKSYVSGKSFWKFIKILLSNLAGFWSHNFGNSNWAKKTENFDSTIFGQIWPKRGWIRPNSIILMSKSCQIWCQIIFQSQKIFLREVLHKFPYFNFGFNFLWKRFYFWKTFN